MDTIGVDLHKRETQVCIGQADGTITEQRIVTSRERFTAVLGHRPPARILVEASTESEWVACHLESLGHEVIVADPNYAPMYATRSRRVKTDKRDARTLMEACRAGTYRPHPRLRRPSSGRAGPLHNPTSFGTITVTIVRVGEVRFRVYPQDHLPRHVHGFIGSGEVIVDLRADGSVALANWRNAVSHVTRVEVKKVLAAAGGAFDQLTEAWEAMHDG